MPAGAPPYVVRRQAVATGPERVLVAVFPLARGAACLQLQDEGRLRRGGVYLLAEDHEDAPGIAPRFDELFGELGARATDDAARARLAGLLRAAQAAAVGTRPRLDPAALEGLLRVARDAAALDSAPAPGSLSAEALVMACMLIFVSEEERYPRPRYRGSDVALETLLEVLASAANGARGGDAGAATPR